jgi:hypothetical protein
MLCLSAAPAAEHSAWFSTSSDVVIASYGRVKWNSKICSVFAGVRSLFSAPGRA